MSVVIQSCMLSSNNDTKHQVEAWIWEAAVKLALDNVRLKIENYVEDLDFLMNSFENGQNNIIYIRWLQENISEISENKDISMDSLKQILKIFYEILADKNFYSENMFLKDVISLCHSVLYMIFLKSKLESIMIDQSMFFPFKDWSNTKKHLKFKDDTYKEHYLKSSLIFNEDKQSYLKNEKYEKYNNCLKSLLNRVKKLYQSLLSKQPVATLVQICSEDMREQLKDVGNPSYDFIYKYVTKTSINRNALLKLITHLDELKNQVKEEVNEDLLLEHRVTQDDSFLSTSSDKSSPVGKLSNSISDNNCETEEGDFCLSNEHIMDRFMVVVLDGCVFDFWPATEENMVCTMVAEQRLNDEYGVLSAPPIDDDTAALLQQDSIISTTINERDECSKLDGGTAISDLDKLYSLIESLKVLVVQLSAKCERLRNASLKRDVSPSPSPPASPSLIQVRQSLPLNSAHKNLSLDETVSPPAVQFKSSNKTSKKKGLKNSPAAIFSPKSMTCIPMNVIKQLGKENNISVTKPPSPTLSDDNSSPTLPDNNNSPTLSEGCITKAELNLKLPKVVLKRLPDNILNSSTNVRNTNASDKHSIIVAAQVHSPMKGSEVSDAIPMKSPPTNKRKSLFSPLKRRVSSPLHAEDILTQEDDALSPHYDAIAKPKADCSDNRSELSKTKCKITHKKRKVVSESKLISRMIENPSPVKRDNGVKVIENSASEGRKKRKKESQEKEKRKIINNQEKSSCIDSRSTEVTSASDEIPKNKKAKKSSKAPSVCLEDEETTFDWVSDPTLNDDNESDADSSGASTVYFSMVGSESPNSLAYPSLIDLTGEDDSSSTLSSVLRKTQRKRQKTLPVLINRVLRSSKL